MFLGEYRVLQFRNFVSNCRRENHVVAESIFFDRNYRSQLMAHVAQERTDALTEFDDVHLHGDGDDTFGQLRQLMLLLAIQTIPVAFGRVAHQIASSVRVALLTELLILRIAGQQFLLAVASIEQTLRVVALLIAVAIIEHLPAADCRRAISPRIYAQRTIATIEVARIRIAFLVTFAIAFLFAAAVFRALHALPLQIQFNRFQSAVVRAVTSECWIEFVARLSRPMCRTQATEIVQFIRAGSAPFARIRLTFVVRIDLAIDAARSERTITTIAAAVEHLTCARIARIRIAIVTGEFAVFAVKTVSAHAMMSIVLGRTKSAVLTRRRCAEVDLNFAMPAHVT